MQKEDPISLPPCHPLFADSPTFPKVERACWTRKPSPNPEVPLNPHPIADGNTELSANCKFR